MTEPPDLGAPRREEAQIRQAARAEAVRIQEYSLWTAATYYAAATWLGRVHLVLGSVALALGAFGAYSGFKSGSPELAGALALVSGILGSLISFWNPADARARQLEAASKYKVLENQARRAREFHDPNDGYEQAHERVKALAERYDELVEQMAPTSDLAFRLASTKIRQGIYQPDPPGPAPRLAEPSKPPALPGAKGEAPPS